MLTESQVATLWQNKMSAEARACYFAEIASRESQRKRWLAAITFVSGSGTVVMLMSHGPNWLSVGANVLIALISGYQIAFGQDSKIRTAGKLHLGWLQLEHDYDRLWSNVYGDDAEATFDRYLERERDLSETAALDLEHDAKLWKKWIDIIHVKHDNASHERQPQDTDSALTSVTERGCQ